MKSKPTHSLLLLLAAAPFALAQIPAGTAPAIADPASATPSLPALPGGADVLPVPDETPVPGLPPVKNAVVDPAAPATVPGGERPSALAPGRIRSVGSTGGALSPTPAPGLTPLPPPTPSHRPEPKAMPAPPAPPLPPVPTPVEQEYPGPGAGSRPNAYFQKHRNPPAVVTTDEARLAGPMNVSATYEGAPRGGEEVIRDIKFKVLQRHYESTLSEAVEAEKAAVFASGGEKEALSAKAKALQAFAAKLEADLRALPGASRAIHTQNEMRVYGHTGGEEGWTGPRSGVAGRVLRLTSPDGGEVHVDAAPPVVTAPLPAPMELRVEERSTPSGGASGLPQPRPVPPQ